MKGLKFLAACAVVGAVSVACAAASFAVDTTYRLTVSDYNATNGTIDITVPTAYAELVKGDYTLLVLSDDATSITEANKSIIKQIQQGDNTILTGVKVGTITPTEADQTFYVRVGGANATEANPTGFAAGTFTVPGTASGTTSYTLGDVNVDTYIDMGDAAAILNHFTGDKIIEDETALLAADVNVDTYVDMGDAAAILNHFTGDKLIVQPE